MYKLYNPLIVSNNFLQRGFSENVKITPMKLQKLLYFLYREYLQNTNRPLFAERFEAWKYGPVLSAVYSYFKPYHAGRITEYYRDENNKASKINEKSNIEFEKAFENVWYNYKSYTGIELSEMTHQKDSAWYKAWMSDKYFLLDDDIQQERQIEVSVDE